MQLQFQKNYSCATCSVLISPFWTYFPIVCNECDKNAKNNVGGASQFGDNPVFIEKKQCWRLGYRFGGYYATVLDKYNCNNFEEYHKKWIEDLLITGVFFMTVSFIRQLPNKWNEGIRYILMKELWGLKGMQK